MQLLIIWVCYGVPMLLLALHTVKTLLRSDCFRYTFYRILTFDIIINIIFYLNSIPIKWMMGDEIFKKMAALTAEYPILWHISDFLRNWSYHMQSQSLVIKCVFRYTASRYTKASFFWDNHYKLIYFSMLICSIIVTAPYILVLYVYSLKNNDAEGWETFSMMLNTETFVYFVLTSFFAFLTFQKIGQLTSTQRMRSFRRVVVCDLMVHIIFFFGISFPPIILPDISITSKFSMAQFLSDMMTFSTPCILLLCDNTFRQEFFKMTRRTVVTSISVTTVRESKISLRSRT